MNKKLNDLVGNISCFYRGSIFLPEPFINLANKFASKPGSIFLLSSHKKKSIKHNILGINPWLTFYAKNKKMSITINNEIFEFEADPFYTLKYLLKICDVGNIKTNVPIINGLIGYLGYDLSNTVEKIPRTTIDDLYLPDLVFFIPSIIIIQDSLKNNIRVFTSSSQYENIRNQKKNINNFKLKLKEKIKFNKFTSHSKEKNKSNFTRKEYIEIIKKIKKYISKGEVYQVNMSQRFSRSFQGDSFSFFKEIYNMNPAPFFSYINAGNHHIISSSPERLVMRKRNKIEVRPIKGTRPRGKTWNRDKILKNELLKSLKDDAELSMIVDLLRNDLSKVSLSGTIKILKHKKIEAYQNVFHLVSTIQSKLCPSKDTIDLIKAIFPGGSITGCPKIRSMILIDKLETNRRHIYTGSIGYLSFHHTTDLSIAIRTAIIFKHKIYLSTGGGIVHDSNPEEEFNETIYKGQNFLNIFARQQHNNFDNKNNYMPFFWLNGKIKLLKRKNIIINDLGLMYGFGFFETLLVKKKYIYLLNEHIQRFNITWKALFNLPILDLSWNNIINEVIKANKTYDQKIVIKIIATKGELITKNNYNGSIMVIAKYYKKRLIYKKQNGFKVAIYPESRYTPLAIYKTLNYLFYFRAGIWAKKNNLDEAIILNPNGTVSEGNSSNIIIINNDTVINPKSEFSLPGIMLNAVINELKIMNYKIVNRKIKPIELFNENEIYLTNSLMGIQPVIELNSKKIKHNLILPYIINKKLINN